MNVSATDCHASAAAAPYGCCHVVPSAVSLAGPSFFRRTENWASRRRIFVFAAEFRDATEIEEIVVLPRKTT